MKRILITILLLTAGLALGGHGQATDQPLLDGDPAFECMFAQADPEMPPPPGDGPGFGPGEKRFERLRMMKMMELLEIKEDQKEEFLALSKEYRDQKSEIMKAHFTTTDTLAEGLRRNDLSENDILRLVDKLEALEAERLGIEKKFHDRVRTVLTAEQFGKLIVFEMRFEARLLNRLNDMRRHHPGMGPGGRGRWQGQPDQTESDSI